jgi:hypothetical protein
MVMKKAKGDQAVSIQEKVSERMRERMVQFRSLMFVGQSGEIRDFARF